MIVRVCDRCGEYCESMQGPKVFFKTTIEQAVAELQGEYLGAMDLCEKCWNSFTFWYESKAFMAQQQEETIESVQGTPDVQETQEPEQVKNVEIVESAQDIIFEEIAEEIIPEIGNIQIIEEEQQPEEVSVNITETVEIKTTEEPKTQSKKKSRKK